MKAVSFLLVGLSPGSLASAQKALRLSYPDARAIVVRDLDEAMRQGPSADTEILLLDKPGRAEIRKAVEAEDAAGLARWGVMAFATTPDGGEVELLPNSNPDGIFAAEAFKSAAAKHRLRRENMRLEGDMLTISRRVNHDLRSPLGGVVTAAEALKDTLTDDPSGAAALLPPIFDSVEGMTRFIERVTFVIRASVEHPPFERIDMGQVVHEVLERLESAMLKFQTRATQPSKWTDVEGVNSWLHVIWWNLLTNALQHGGNPHEIEMGWEQDGAGCKFWVRDHGPGIPPEKRKLLFQPFNLLHQPDAARGLGLSIVERLVSLHGGRCGYEPASGRGSLFHFTLPR